MIPESRRFTTPNENMDLEKIMLREVNSVRYIYIFLIGWFASNTTIRFRLDHNQVIDTLFYNQNLLYILGKSKVEINEG